MEGRGTPKNEQNQFCHSPSVKAMTPSEVERQDSHAAGVKYSLRDLSPSLMQAVKMECRGSPASASGAASTTCVRWRFLAKMAAEDKGSHCTGLDVKIKSTQEWSWALIRFDLV